MELGYINNLGEWEPYYTDDSSTLFVGGGNRSHRNFVRLALDDIHAGKPVVFVGACEEILRKIPKDRQQDVQLIRPSLQPFALNILSDKHLKIHSALLDFLKGFWDYDKVATPNLDMYFRAGIRTVADADHTFLHIDKLFTDPKFLDYMLSLNDSGGKFASRKIGSPLLRKFWKQFRDKSEKDRMQETASTRNKLWAFLLDEEICHCLVQKDSKLDFEKIVLVDLDENTRILGIFILTQLYLIGGTTVYIEDAQLYGNGIEKLIPRMQTMLSISNFSSCSSSFSKDTIPTILGSVDRIVAYRIGIDDYRRLEPVFGLSDLERKPYSFHSGEALETRYGVNKYISVRYHDYPDEGYENKIIRRCRSQYTQPIEKIKQRMRDL